MKDMKVLYALALLLVSVFLHVSSVFATIPTVSSVSPGSGAGNVPVNTSVVVNFNTPMDASTVTKSSFYIQDPYGNKAAILNPVATNAGATFTIETSQPLSPCTTYTVVVTAAVRSADTNTPMAVGHSQTFSTVSDLTPPTILSTLPANFATSVSETAEIQVMFDRMMDTSTIDSTRFYLTPAVTGIIDFKTTGNATVAIFKPDTNLVSSASYTATVSDSVRSACGASMSTSKTWDFTVRNVNAPMVVSTLPSAGSGTALRTTNIIITFNESVQTISGSNISLSRTSDSAPVSGTVIFNSVTKLSATFKPTAPLELNTEYTVNVINVSSAVSGHTDTTSYSFSFTTVEQDIAQYCNIPTSVSRKTVQPNVLLIMDNSNSMDEGFGGDALGSYHPDSKSVVGKIALSDIVNTYSDIMRIGLMTYNLPASTKRYINNSPYFVSYDPKSYCPNPTATTLEACDRYCRNASDTTSGNECEAGCQLGNPQFRRAYTDSIITAHSQRAKYCGLVYPKTKTMVATSSVNGSTVRVYYKQALPMYSSGNDPTYHIYGGTSYLPGQEITNTSTSTGSYTMYRTKTGESDTSGYTDSIYTSSFQATDSDIALGYGNFGQRMVTIPVGRTWFAEGSPGGGYLQVEVASNNSVNTHRDDLLNKLMPYSNNPSDYMDACTTATSISNPNICQYIINAGLTPTVGTLQTAIDYFKGNLSKPSPIQETCQNNYIVYVTDGLPSVDQNGNTRDSNYLMSDVLQKLRDLQALKKDMGGGMGEHPFPVKTYIVGLGMNATDREKLESMAEAGGAGQLFLANSQDDLAMALRRVFLNITAQTSSGSSASVVNNRGESGSNLFQADFHPKKEFIDKKNVITELSWIGELQNLWYYLDPYMSVSTIREDTDNNRELDLKKDMVVTSTFDSSTNTTLTRWYTDDTGRGTTFTLNRTGTPDEIRALWRAGALLHKRTAQSRDIYSTVADGYNSDYPALSGLTAFNVSASGLFSSPMGTAADTSKIIEYVRGVDNPSYRSRFVKIDYPSTNPPPLNATVPESGADASVGVWKLGAIVSSTPQSLTAKQLHAFDTAYSDQSYAKFYNSRQYNDRNMVFVGANDGMLHAFRVGKVMRPPHDTSQPFRISIIDKPVSPKIGEEEWAFIPKNALPYLKYLADPDYNHMYFVDNTVSLLDASINRPTPTASTDTPCTQAEYWKCDKKTTYPANSKDLDFSKTSWRTVLIGGMGMGGASRNKLGYCNMDNGAAPTNSADETRQDCVKSPVDKVGLSSFFALDVTDPASPKFMWEFSDAILSTNDKGLGFALSGPAFVRISGRKDSGFDYGPADVSLNGRWFAVFATGPSGPINAATNQFMGKSDNNLKVYVVDVNPDISSGWVKDVNYWVFDSGIKNAFAGDLNGAVVDVDRRSPYSNGYYSDDVVYIGYTRPDVTMTATVDGAGTKWNQADVNASSKWTEGGVLRLLTNDSLNPTDWTLSTMIDGVGPVTTAVSILQDRQNGKLRTYFGSGRYYYRDETGGDDPGGQRYLMGVEDSCYNGSLNSMDAGFKRVPPSGAWGKQGCAISAPPPLTLSSLHIRNASDNNIIPDGKKGWAIALDPKDTPPDPYVYDAERLLTNTTTTSSGLVLFTTFKPSGGLCDFGGMSYLWIVDYANGGRPPNSALKGKVLVQLSNGQFIAVDISTVVTGIGNIDGVGGYTSETGGGIRFTLGAGQAGRDRAAIQTPPKPVQKILHIMER